MTAEKQYREAFERLKLGKPERIETGSPVTQNNVAREAGSDPSALRKARFPSLIAEIQRYLIDAPPPKKASKRQEKAAARKRSRNLKDRLLEVAKQRDKLASLLLEADATILDLRLKLQAKPESRTSSVVGIRKTKSRQPDQ